MFIKVNILFHPDEPFEVMTSCPGDAFKLIVILDKSDKVVAWNMDNSKPEDFGWLKSIHWNKYKINFFKD